MRGQTGGFAAITIWNSKIDLHNLGDLVIFIINDGAVKIIKLPLILICDYIQQHGTRIKIQIVAFFFLSFPLIAENRKYLVINF